MFQKYHNNIMLIAHYAVCALFSMTMFFGVLQIGFKWENKQPEYGVMISLRGGAPSLGAIRQNWSGDFIFVDYRGDETVFALDQLRFMYGNGNATPLGTPWRAMLSILLAIAAAGFTAIGSLRATKAWIEPVNRGIKRIAPRSQSQAVVTPDAIKRAASSPTSASGQRSLP